ncbi:glycosyltransferase [Dongia deserti]|uniref:glycosyltransferase n=1 Tax=Dongia deserti TaxID=2268030 RepID=UPI000E657D5D|nr:glycosyltransferase [Dongia deserti]
MASVDVVVPCYQYGRFLRGCVASVLQQGIEDVRVLIVDNASTDDTSEVARTLAVEDARVEVVTHRTNLGHLTSFNEGVDWAEADYFMVLCADDLLAPGALARAISVMDDSPRVNLTFGRELIITPESSSQEFDQLPRSSDWCLIEGRALLDRLCRSGRPDASRFMIPGTTAIVRTSAQKRVGHYRVHLPHTADLDMWLRFACTGDAVQIDAIQGIRRVHPRNRSASVYDCHKWDLEWEAAFESFFQHEGARLPNARRLHRIARRALAERAYWGCFSNLLRGNFALSGALLWYAVTRCPDAAIFPPFGYLLRNGDSVVRIQRVLSEIGIRWHAPVEGNSDAH